MIEFFLILLLLVGNGVFAMTEIALVSARRARLQQLAEEGNEGAQKALALLQNPERFLSSVQIGIRLVGVLSGAFGGAAFADKLEPVFASVPLLEPYARQIAFGLIVTMITYLSLVIGELVPKGIALRHAEKLAVVLAPPMMVLTRLAAPLVGLLEGSTRIVMRLLGNREAVESGPTRDEVRVLVRQGIITGTVFANESEMVDGVFDLQKLSAEEIMQPRPKVRYLHLEASLEEISRQIAGCGQSVFPVHHGSRDDVVGLVSIRDLFLNLAGADPKPLRALLSPPVFVSELQSALSLMEMLRTSPLGVAMVTDEFGTIRGMVGLEDLVEEIVGDLRPDSVNSDMPRIRKSGEDAWVIDGMMEIDDVIDEIPDLKEVVERESEPFQTMAGYVLNLLDRLPDEGERFQAGGFQFEVIDIDRQRIDKISVTRMPVSDPEEGKGDQ